MNKIRITQTEEIVKSLRSLIETMNADEFNERDTGLSLLTFIYVFTITICTMKHVTLEGLAIKCQELQYGLSLSKQALHKRLAKGKKELEKLLAFTVLMTMMYKVEKPNTAVVLKQFAAVLITDATIITLPDKLAIYHQGLGGTNADSAMKIQATYDLIGKTFRKISQRNSSKENDTAYMDELIENINANELSITDLGYFGVRHFKKIDEKGAYFISKIKSNTILYNVENGKSIRIVDELKDKDDTDQMVMIKGDNGKISMKVRLCGIKLPSKVYAERIRKARKENAGKTLSKEKRERLKWILIITNVPEDMLSFDAVCEIYRLRWTIELIFKSWKSYFSIDKMNNIGKDYWDCLLYGRLIIITMLTALHSQFHYSLLETSERGISFLRFMKNMRDNLDTIMNYFIYQKSDEDISITINRVIFASLIEKRRRKTTEQTIAVYDLPCDCIKLISDLAA